MKLQTAKPSEMELQKLFKKMSASKSKHAVLSLISSLLPSYGDSYVPGFVKNKSYPILHNTLRDSSLFTLDKEALFELCKGVKLEVTL